MKVDEQLPTADEIRNDGSSASTSGNGQHGTSFSYTRVSFQTIEPTRICIQWKHHTEIGPGVYDIHSPNVPTVDWMVQLIKRATSFLPKEQIWVNPDCGLKTRGPVEAQEALIAMVEAARLLRKEFSN